VTNERPPALDGEPSLLSTCWDWGGGIPLVEHARAGGADKVVALLEAS
jgi:hypothetical protein